MYSGRGCFSMSLQSKGEPFKRFRLTEHFSFTRYTPKMFLDCKRELTLSPPSSKPWVGPEPSAGLSSIHCTLRGAPNPFNRAVPPGGLPSSLRWEDDILTLNCQVCCRRVIHSLLGRCADTLRSMENVEYSCFTNKQAHVS